MSFFAAEHRARALVALRRLLARLFDNGLFEPLVLLGVLSMLTTPGYGLAVVALVSVVPEAACLAKWGTTPGKKLLGLCVRNQNGGRADLVTLVIRTFIVRLLAGGIGNNLLMVIIWGLGFGSVVWRKGMWRQDVLWDAIEHTRVESAPISAGRFILVGIVAIALFIAGMTAGSILIQRHIVGLLR